MEPWSGWWRAWTCLWTDCRATFGCGEMAGLLASFILRLTRMSSTKLRTSPLFDSVLPSSPLRYVGHDVLPFSPK